MLNKIKPGSNMYKFVTATWNACKGICPHDCKYCYCKRFKQNPLRFDSKELQTDLGSGNFIFVGSSCDMWAEAIDTQWICEILAKCRRHDNRYLFQSKNPDRFIYFQAFFPKNIVLGTTIETNRYNEYMGNTPEPVIRAEAMWKLANLGYETMVTIEPIMDFDLEQLVSLLKRCAPTWVNIGADSKGHSLPEPKRDKIIGLIDELSKTIKVIRKQNLKRLMR